MVHLWIVDIYHQTVHRGIRDIPYRRWTEAVKQWPPNLPPRSSDLEVLIGFTEKRAIGASGIELFTLRYNCAELASLRRNLEKGEKATIRYNPQDISVIYVHDRVEDRLIPVPAMDQDYTRKLSIWQHHIIRRYARRTIEAHIDIEALCRAKEKIQQIVERERLLTGKMRSKQKIARYLNLGQQISAGIADHAVNPTDLGPSHMSDGKSQFQEKAVSGDENAPGQSSPLIAQALPLNQPGWGADYSLPVGNGQEEVTK